MPRLKSIFMVVLVAVMSAGLAYADVASVDLLDKKGQELSGRIDELADVVELFEINVEDNEERIKGLEQTVVKHPKDTAVGGNVAAGGSNPVYVDAQGNAVEIDTVAKAAVANAAKQIPFGSENATTYVSIWVE